MTFFLFVTLRLCLPWLVSFYLQNKIGHQLAEKSQIELRWKSLKINGLSIVLDNLTLNDNTVPSLGTFSTQRMTIKFSISDLIRFNKHIQRINIDGGQINLKMTTDETSIESIKELAKKRLQSFFSTPSLTNNQHKTTTSSIQINALSAKNILLVIQDPYFQINGSFDIDLARFQPAFISIKNLVFDANSGIYATAKKISIFVDKNPALLGHSLPSFYLENGMISPFSVLKLDNIYGHFSPQNNFAKRGSLNFYGGISNVKNAAWKAIGLVELSSNNTSIQNILLNLTMKEFTLAHILPLFENGALLSPQDTAVNANLNLRYTNQTLFFDGHLGIKQMTISHIGLSQRPVSLDSFIINTKGWTNKKEIHFEPLSFQIGDIKLNMNMEAALQPLYLRQHESQEACRWQEKWKYAKISVDLPKTSCDKAFSAIPVSFIPHLSGLRFSPKDTLSGHIESLIDFQKLAELRRTKKSGEKPVFLNFSLDVDKCTPTKLPANINPAKIMWEPFLHSVKLPSHEGISWVIGDEEQDFVPFQKLSPYFVASIQTTEDDRFFTHHGFIPSEFLSALEKNLLHCHFKLGASSISMQFVKNVILSPEKTLSRKFQEIVLTWLLEKLGPFGRTQQVFKERLFALYANAIEFGPGIYGIGPATNHYFNKEPALLTPKQAAWFSSILPNPKTRYVYYCLGEPDEKWNKYLNRILTVMYNRKRLTTDEYNAALTEKILFDRTNFMFPSTKSCLTYVQQFTSHPLNLL